MFNAGVPEKVVKEITGHCSDAVHKYEHTGLSLKHKAVVTISNLQALVVSQKKNESVEICVAQGKNYEKSPIVLSESDEDEIPCTQILKVQKKVLHNSELAKLVQVDKVLGKLLNQKVKKVKMQIEVDLDSE